MLKIAKLSNYGLLQNFLIMALNHVCTSFACLNDEVYFMYVFMIRFCKD